MNYELLKKDLRIDEGVRFVPYQDAGGNWTVGIGHLMSNPLSESAVESILQDDIAIAEVDARKIYPQFGAFSEIRQRAIVELLFNLGYNRYMTFNRHRAAIEENDWDTAAAELIDSKWYRKDVQASRSERVISMIRNG